MVWTGKPYSIARTLDSIELIPEHLEIQETPNHAMALIGGFKLKDHGWVHVCLFVLFVLRLNVPVNNFSVMLGRFLGITSTTTFWE